MLLIHRAQNRRGGGRVGLAVAGGGPLGGTYELGALRALEEAIEGLDLTSLDVYVGVSSGAFIAAGLANGISSAEMVRIYILGDPDEPRFRPETFLRPAFREFLRRSGRVPRIFADWLRDLLRHPGGDGFGEIFGSLGTLVPTGLFDNEAIGAFLSELFSRPGRSDDFRKLKRLLYIVAVELDTGEIVRFGAPGHDHVPISRAVQASAALPGLYPPVEIDGRYFVDGALRRTLHASVAMDEGIDLLIGLNPLVPFDARLARGQRRHAGTTLLEGGLPAVLSQTFRTLLQSRMQVGLAKYDQAYPRTDRIICEADPDDAELFFTNVFSYSSRRRMCEHAYRRTLSDLAARRSELEAILSRHGLRLRAEVVEDRQRSLFDGIPPRRPASIPAIASLRNALDSLERHLAARRLGRKRARSPRA
jgi:predicted acylesterase/phospholipase RssA